MANDENPLKALRAPFPDHQISKLPKETKKQADDRKANMKLGIRCGQCGQWHHKDAVHLDYVGHAALTDRLLDVDPTWNWEPVAFTSDGMPAYDRNGGMWIRLTVCGQTRLGYGNADGKSGGDAVKEIIGDALRNAAMRFGAALDLWHKGDLHKSDDDDGAADEKTAANKPASSAEQKRQLAEIDKDLLDAFTDADVKRCAEIWKSIATRDGWSRDYMMLAKEKFDARRRAIAEESDFPGDFPGSDDIRHHPLNAG